MSIFHETMRDILEDVQRFLNITLQREHLSAGSLSHRESLLMKIHHLRAEYPQLHLQLIVEPSKDGSSSENSNVEAVNNPPPYIDMHGNSGSHNVDTEYVYSDTMVDEYEVCDSTRDVSSIDGGLNNNSNNNSSSRISKVLSDEGDSISEYKEHEIPSIPASDSTNFVKCGYLEKKGKDRLGGWLNLYQKRFVALKDSILFLYNKSTDKRPYCMLPLSGYDICQSPPTLRDANKKEACFELVGPGKKTYQFVAANGNDAKQWIEAIQKVISSIPRETQVTLPRPTSILAVSENNCSVSNHHEQHNTDKSREDIYEVVEDVSNEHSLVEEELYGDADTEPMDKVDGGVSGTGAITNVEDPLGWYVGLWDCISSCSDELDFKRGDLIHIVDKEYDDYKWWVGDLDGHVGLVPKDYLMKAYEPFDTKTI